MTKLAVTLVTILVLQMFTACSSAPRFTQEEWQEKMKNPNEGVYTTKRIKHSDKNMRIMVAPSKAVGPANIQEIQTLLVSQDKWSVVDRNLGFKAVVSEQNLQHLDMNERMDDKQKWAHWGKLYGVGAIIVPFGHCENATEEGFFGHHRKDKIWCDASLTMIDANTGEVIVAVSREMKIAPGRVGNWEPLISELADKYPSDFTPEQKYQNVIDYENESVRNANKKKFE